MGMTGEDPSSVTASLGMEKIMSLFKLKSKFKPAGDQPQAIAKLSEGLKKGNRYQTLLCVTGSGKTFTIANVISQQNRPVLVMAPNKALAAQLYREYKNFFPQNSVNYFVSYYDYYQPEAYMPTSDTYIDKEAMINEEIDRLRHQATSALMSRRDVIIVASVSCIYNLGVPNNYFASAVHLTVGQPMTRGDLTRQLIKIQFSRTPGDFEITHSAQIAEQVIRPTGLIDPPIEVRPVNPTPYPSPNRGGSDKDGFVSPTSILSPIRGETERGVYKGQVDDLMKEIDKVVKNGERAIVNVLTKKMAEELNEFLLAKKYAVNYLHSDIKIKTSAKFWI